MGEDDAVAYGQQCRIHSRVRVDKVIHVPQRDRHLVLDVGLGNFAVPQHVGKNDKAARAQKVEGLRERYWYV